MIIFLIKTSGFLNSGYKYTNFMKIFFTLLFSVFACKVFAMTGNEWLNLEATGNRDVAVRYIQGLSDMQNYVYHTDKRIADKENKPFISYNYLCPPVGSTYGQYFEIIKKFLNENPEHGHLQMPDLMFFSLGKIWRCKEQ